MLKRIHLKNYAKHKDLELNFSDGLTAICGKNGGGKTLIVEAVSFALFGSKELRGSKSDYASDLSVELDIEIKGKPYKIVRTLDNCKINDVVVGTTECNKFIAALLGFGSDVYNFSIYSKQGDLTRLTDVAPAERKACIDALIGAKQIDNVIKNVRAELNSYKAKAAAFQTTLDNMPKQVAPSKPASDRKEAEEQLALVKTAMTEANNLLAEKHRLENSVAKLETTLPEKPKDLIEQTCLVESAKRISEIENRKFRVESLERELGKYPKADNSALPTKDELDRQTRLNVEWQPTPSRPKPNLTMDEATELRFAWEKRDRWEKSPKTICPKCGCEFSEIEEPPIPSMTKDDLDEQFCRIAAWTGVPENVESLEKPSMTVNEISALRRKIEAAENRSRIEAELASISDEGFSKIADLKEKLEVSERYWKQMCVVAEAKNTADAARARISQIDERISELNKVIKSLPLEVDLEKIIYDWTNYELQVKLFEQNESMRRSVESDLKDAVAQSDKYEAALAGLIEFKRRVKTFVIPSLESVASQMISEMSAGELNRFEIGEDFDILLDGKKICLLSGSEKALANIALRLSLGRVLTRGVLSLFIADEIDASMSEERAEEVHSALMRLRDGGKLRQILVITHKSLECDKEIEVGK